MRVVLYGSDKEGLQRVGVVSGLCKGMDMASLRNRACLNRSIETARSKKCSRLDIEHPNSAMTTASIT